MKTSPIKAVIRLMLNTTRQYAIDITFVITPTCFHNPVITNRFHNVVMEKKPLKMECNICTHFTVNYTNTHENWADSFYHSGNTGKSHNPHIWHLFSALSVSLCKTVLQFCLSLVITGIIECVVNTSCCCCCFFNKRNISMYIKICKQPNQLCCKV